MNTNPSMSWQQLHDVFYSLRPCYDSMSWSIANQFGDNVVKLSQTASLVALASKYAPHPSVIDIYTVSGTKLWSVVFNNTPTEHIVGFGFAGEDLYVALSSCKVRHYVDLKGTFNELNCLSELIVLDDFSPTKVFASTDFAAPQTTSSDSQCVSVHIWDSYILLQLRRRFIIADLAAETNYELPVQDSVAAGIHCVAFGSKKESGLSVVISYKTTVVSLQIDTAGSSFEVVDHELTEGPFETISTSPNGQLVALFNKDVSTVFVINSSFNQVLLEYNASNDSSEPYQVEWCGNDAIVLSFRDEMKLVGPGQRSLSFFYDIIEEEDLTFDSVLKGANDLSFTIPILKTQPDGLKVITANKFEFLSRVPQASINLYQIASSHPSSLLLDCIDKLSQHSSKADTNMSLLKADNALIEAINGCLQAALQEFNPYWQKKVLAAVSFGKAYCDTYYDAEEYLRVVNTLKVLNQLRSAEVAIFLTNEEVEQIGWRSVIHMLLSRDQHLLALKVVDLLDLQHLKDDVYIHWCCYRIKKDVNASDLDLFKTISKKLLSARESPQGINYLSISKISNIAYEEGRPDLCKLLINLEPSTVNKVQQYLKFDDVELALIKAFQAGDDDLSKLILLHLRAILTIPQFFKILNQTQRTSLITDTSAEIIKEENIVIEESLFVDGDLVGNFWKETLGSYDPDTLELYYKQEDQRGELATLGLQTFKQKPIPEFNPEAENQYYQDYRAKLLKLMDYSGDRRNFKSYQLELDILELRKKLSETYLNDFYCTKTLNSVLVKLIEMNQLKQASKIVKDFKVSQEKFWNLVLETYCKQKQFERLHQFILLSSSDQSNLKSPIGFQIIVDTCLAYNAPKDNVSLYISNCANMHYTDKIELYIKNDDLVAAAGEAFKYKDAEFLNSILDRAKRAKSPDATLATIEDYVSKLGGS